MDEAGAVGAAVGLDEEELAGASTGCMLTFISLRVTPSSLTGAVDDAGCVSACTLVPFMVDSVRGWASACHLIEMMMTMGLQMKNGSNVVAHEAQ